MRNQFCRLCGRYKEISLRVMRYTGKKLKYEPEEKKRIMDKVGSVLVIMARGVMGNP
jgi:hypothetical protein